MRRIGSDAKIPHHLPILIGTKVNSAVLMNDLDGKPGLFFVFHDLSIRIEGVFRLKFSLIDVEGSQGLVQKSHVAASVFSEPFTVFTPKAFPGMSDSSDLSKAFAAQGLKIPIRKDRIKILSMKKSTPSSSKDEPLHLPDATVKAEEKADHDPLMEDATDDAASMASHSHVDQPTATDQTPDIQNPTKRPRLDQESTLDFPPKTDDNIILKEGPGTVEQQHPLNKDGSD